MAEDPKVTTASELAPIPVPMIGTGDGKFPQIETGMEAETPGKHVPNVVFQVIPPIVAIGVRFANQFLTTLVALTGAAMVSDVIPASDFMHLVLKCATLSVAGAGFGAMKDLVTIFSKLEGKYPLLTGAI